MPTKKEELDRKRKIANRPAECRKEARRLRKAGRAKIAEGLADLRDADSYDREAEWRETDPVQVQLQRLAKADISILEFKLRRPTRGKDKAPRNSRSVDRAVIIAKRIDKNTKALIADKIETDIADARAIIGMLHRYFAVADDAEGAVRLLNELGADVPLENPSA